ncbi:MAG TPA: FAD-binding oxidoreductase, partial [Anaeromyxobacteraceae bacterium]|nr:FAD-binding oxidoreductase [Anaeromyxobacteraceae bacterium]
REGLTVSVRAGGHGVAGRACRDGSLVVDLRPMRGVAVDPGARRARVEGGATWADVDRAAAAHGLATTGGLISSTGVSGLTLGGGIGWLVRRFGLACDSLVAAEVVTADGASRRVDEREGGELLWALRGAGIGLGVVTALEFALHPISTVVAGVVMHPASRAHAVARFFRELTARAPDALSAILVFAVAPPAPFVPVDLQGQPMVAIGACWSGHLAGGEDALAPLQAFGPPAVDTIRALPYVEAQSMLDPTAPAHQLNYWKSAFLPALTDDLLEALVRRGTSLPSPLAQIHVHHLGGAVDRVPADATAYASRGMPYLANVPTMWSDRGRTAEMIEWTRSCHAEITGAGGGAGYLNFQDRDERPGDALGAGRSVRLRALKEALDPGRLFGPEPIG